MPDIDLERIRRPRGNPRWTKVRRDVWQHKPRTALVVAAIAIGITGAGAVLDTWSLLRRVTHGEFAASNPASATLTTEAIDTALLDRVRALPGIAAAQARTTCIASILTTNGWRTAILFARDDFTANRIGSIKSESGTWPPVDGSWVIEASSVDFAATAVGESLTVQFRDARPRRLAITGIARDVGLAPGWMEHVIYGFATPATLQALGAPAAFDELQVLVADRGADREAVRRLAATVRNLVEQTGRTVRRVDVPVPGRHIHAAQIDSLLFTQGAFGVLALLSSAILVVNLIGAMLAGQVREIGVMKTIGAQSRQIATMYLGLALVLGLAACVVAIPAAALIGIQYARFTADTLNFDIHGFTIPPHIFLLQLAVGALLPVAAASLPVWRGCRISVGAALRDFGIEASRASGRRIFGARWQRVSRPLLLSLRNAFRRRQRMALTLATLACGGAVFLGALDLRTAVRGSVGLLFDSQRYDVGLRFEAPWPAERLEAAIAGVSGVAGVEAWGGVRAALATETGAMGNTFALSAPPESSRMFVPSLRAGRLPQSGAGREIVVNRRLLDDEPGLAVGREVTLWLAGRAAQWTVVGSVDTGPTPIAYTDRKTLGRELGDVRVDRAVVASRARDATTQLELVRALRATLEPQGFVVQSSQLMEQSRKVMEDHMLMVAGFLGVMAQLMIVVGGLGLASTMSLAVLERTREIGVLRALGARHRTIFTLIQMEGLVVAVASWLLALPLSVPMSIVLGRAFGRIMFPVPLVAWPGLAAIAIWLGVAVGVSIVACAWPALRATRITTRAALAYE